DEAAMRDAFAECRRPREILVDMDRVEIAGQAGKQHQIGFADGLGEFRVLADLEEGFDAHLLCLFLLEHDLFRKPVSTFRDHALFTAPLPADRDAMTAAAAACWRYHGRASSIQGGTAAHP